MLMCGVGAKSVAHLMKFYLFPDSIPPLDRRWLLVAWSADFADVGPTLAQRRQDNHNSGQISLYFADVGPTLGQQWIFMQDGGEQ